MLMTGSNRDVNARSQNRLPLRRLLLGALLGLVACSTMSPSPAPGTVTFVVVRHAEKATDDPRDPSLSEAGQASARRLVDALAGTPPTAIYATQYRRTQLTAQPTAQAYRLPVDEYQAQLAAETLARQLRQTHTSGVVLVVGHSNTVPQIATALSGVPVPPMDESVYGVMYRITMGPAQDAVLERTTY